MVTAQVFTIGANVGGFQPLDTIVVLVSFSILLVLLKKFAFGPLMKVMEEREKFIANEIETATKKNQEASAAKEEAEQNLIEARRNAKEMIVEAKKQATQLEESIIQEAKNKAKQIRMDAEEDIEQEKRESFEEMQDTVAEIAFQIAMDIIQKEMTESDQKRLIKERLAAIEDDLL